MSSTFANMAVRIAAVVIFAFAMWGLVFYATGAKVAPTGYYDELRRRADG